MVCQSEKSSFYNFMSLYPPTDSDFLDILFNTNLNQFYLDGLISDYAAEYRVLTRRETLN